MKTEARLRTYTILSLIFGLWFLALGWLWVYLFNVVFVFPLALIGFVL